ncbi:ABC transporter ATP-binding protein [Proteocatella sphenisci]|uniref:ABC transporter ATP-binding protein n=1 Tax=Proteocatella sphenisci TaxID=181070 RepID=UPI000491937A|nr:ABC transporter ATP-binding protein [Proteocatella sphenisci]
MRLSIEGVEFSYPGNPVLEDICFRAAPEEFVAVLGTNGTGKTTLLKCINLILEPEKGTVLIENRCTRDHSRKELAQKMSYVEQRKVSNRIKVFNAILLGRKPYIKWDATREDIEIAHRAIESLGLKRYENRYIDELSGGELQMVMIARAIAQNPKVILMDEPTNHLDLRNQLDVLDVIKKAVRENHLTAIVAMHDINLALRYADRFILMKDKGVFAAGGKEIITASNIEEIYSVPVNIIKCENHTVVVPK